MFDDNLVPLGLLALDGHGDGSVDTLARMLGAEVLIDHTTGLRSVHPTTARRLYDQREHRRASVRAARERAAGQPNPTQARVLALQARAETLRLAGQLDSDMTAFEAMASGDKLADLEGTPSRRMDDYLAGRSRGYRYQIKMED